MKYKGLGTLSNKTLFLSIFSYKAGWVLIYGNKTLFLRAHGKVP